MASKDKRARVGFAPGETQKYIIVQEDGKPYPFDEKTVYEGTEGLEQAQRRAEWLNWNQNSKTAGTYHHPREEAAAKAAQLRADLLAAHKALAEEERLGAKVAQQLRSLRAALAQEEKLAAQQEEWAAQKGHTAKERAQARKEAQFARTRAQGLAKKIAELEAGPAQPSRLARPQRAPVAQEETADEEQEETADAG